MVHVGINIPDTHTHTHVLRTHTHVHHTYTHTHTCTTHTHTRTHTHAHTHRTQVDITHRGMMDAHFQLHWLFCILNCRTISCCSLLQVRMRVFTLPRSSSPPQYQWLGHSVWSNLLQLAARYNWKSASCLEVRHGSVAARLAVKRDACFSARSMISQMVIAT